MLILNKDAKQANTLLNGAITNSVTSITVDTTTGFPASGTLLIGTEEMTYTGKTATTFTGITRNTNSVGAASALDDATVKLASFSDDIFSGFTDKLRNTYAAAKVTSTAPAAGGTLTVGSTEGFPATGTILVGNEKMTYTAKTATTFTIGVKAQGHTTTYTGSEAKLKGAITATSHANGGTMTIDNLTNAPFPKSGTLLVGSEHITYTGWTADTTSRPLSGSAANTLTLSGITRGVNGTTAATGSDNLDIDLLADVSLVTSVETMGLETRTTEINGAINASVTSLTVDSTVGFEDTGFIRVGTE